MNEWYSMHASMVGRKKRHIHVYWCQWKTLNIYHMHYLSKKIYIYHVHYGGLSKYASFLTSLLCVVCYDCVVCLSQLCVFALNCIHLLWLFLVDLALFCSLQRSCIQIQIKMIPKLKKGFKKFKEHMRFYFLFTLETSRHLLKTFWFNLLKIIIIFFFLLL